jgi:SHS2 domain-containing protein
MYRWVDHTAELELQIEASSEKDVFAEALAAFAELVGDGASDGSVRHEVKVRATDRATLLAEWLGELVFLLETDDFVPDRVAELQLAGGELTATVEGHRGAPPHLVKAVTYHGLTMERDGDVWKARLVLDV